MIEVVYKIDHVRDVPRRFPKPYGYEKYDKLQALGESITAEAVNEIMGNTSWTDHKCTECGKDSEKLVRIGEEPDYAAQWVDLCENCLSEAMEKLKEAK